MRMQNKDWGRRGGAKVDFEFRVKTLAMTHIAKMTHMNRESDRKPIVVELIACADDRGKAG